MNSSLSFASPSSTKISHDDEDKDVAATTRHDRHRRHRHLQKDLQQQQQQRRQSILHNGDLLQERLLLGVKNTNITNSTTTPSSSILVERRGNVDYYYSELEQQSIGLCHLYTLLPFTNGDDDTDDKVPWNNIGTYEGVVTIALAISHLNSGTTSIISNISSSSDGNGNVSSSSSSSTNLKQLHETCPLRFTMEIADTELKKSIGINQVIDATNRPFWSPPPPPPPPSGSSSNSSASTTTSSSIHPCGFLGAARSAVSIPTSMITGLRGYPQISPISTSSILNDKVQFPLFARTIPSDDGTAIPLILYYRDVLKITHFGVIHINDAYGNAFAQGIQAAVVKYAPTMKVQMIDIPVDANDETIQRAISFLQTTNYSYFFGILFPTKIVDAVMTEAYKQGIAGSRSSGDSGSSSSGTTWLFSESIGGDIVSRTFSTNTPLERTFLGSGMFSSSSGNSDYNSKLLPLTTALHDIKQSSESLNYIHSILPPSTTGFNVNASEFLSTPGYIGGFLYDATIAMGVAACKAWEQQQQQQDQNEDDDTPIILDGIEHYNKLMETSFMGTSGRLVFNEMTGTRTPESSFFQIVNYMKDETKSTRTMTHYQEIVSYMFHNGEWKQLDNYIFNDGTSIPPQDLIPVRNLESHHFSFVVRITGLLFCAIGISIAIGFVLWTWYNRNNRVLTASQPFFLYLICTGAIVLLSTIIPLSIDEGVTSSISGCTIACQLIPWQISLGFSLSCSALFTKTYRINKIYNAGVRMRRVTVKPHDVAKPMIVLLGADIILLTLWTIFAPLSWDYAIKDRDTFGRVTERYGYCKGEKSTWSYLIPLVVLNLSILFLSVIQAYKARHISIQYAETEYIFLSMLVIILACLLGIPVLILAREDPDAYFFVFSGGLLVTSVSVLLLIFVPKVAYLRAHRKNKKAPPNLARDSGHHLLDFVPSQSSLPRIPSVEDNNGIHHHQESRTLAEKESEEDEDGVSSSESGLLILTHKSKKELLLETFTLRKRLREYEKLVKKDDDDDVVVVSNDIAVDRIVESSNSEESILDDEDEDQDDMVENLVSNSNMMEEEDCQDVDNN